MGAGPCSTVPRPAVRVSSAACPLPARPLSLFPAPAPADRRSVCTHMPALSATPSAPPSAPPVPHPPTRQLTRSFVGRTLHSHRPPSPLPPPLPLHLHDTRTHAHLPSRSSDKIMFQNHGVFQSPQRAPLSPPQRAPLPPFYRPTTPTTPTSRYSCIDGGRRRARTWRWAQRWAWRRWLRASVAVSSNAGVALTLCCTVQ